MAGPGSDSTSVALGVDDLARIAAAREARLSPDGTLVAYCVGGIDLECDRAIAELRFEPAFGGAARGPAEPIPGRAPSWSPAGDAVAFLVDEDGETVVRLLSVESGETRTLASFPGGAGPAAWSPDGARIALAAAPAPGVPARVAVLEVGTGAVAMAPGGGEGDASPTWSPGGEEIAFARAGAATRAGPAGSLWVWRPGTAAVAELATGLAFAACPSWSPDGSELACVGTRERRLGLQDPCLQPWILPAAGGPARLAAEGVNGVIVAAAPEGPIWSGGGERLLFRAAREGDIDVVTVAADDPASMRWLTGGCQVSSLSAAGDGERLAFTACTSGDPGRLVLHRRDWDAWRPDSSTAPAGPLPPLSRRRFAAPHGEQLDGWLQGVDPGRAPQPLLVSMHGGPHNFVGPGAQLGHFHRSVLAARGWIVLTLNSSGSGSYGERFADSIRGCWGERDLPEYLAAVERLVAEGLADPARLAVAGYSYGGYLAAWAICHTDRFKAAVVGAPIADIESFRRDSDIGGWYVPWEMKEGEDEDAELCRRLSPVSHAGAVATPTLILHGEADERCPLGEGEELRERIAAAGRAPVELVRYPGAGHLFYAAGRPSQRLDYNRRIVEWVEQWTLG
jgi:dipeptidyl aminopeptidase/acylaminoacyl peptidase